MLKRTISGFVLSVIFVGALLLNKVTPVITVSFFCIVSAIAVYEMLYNTHIIKRKFIVVCCMAYSVAACALYCFKIDNVYYITVLHILLTAAFSLAFHRENDYTHIAAMLSFPIVLPFGFACIYNLFNIYGIAYILFALNFSSVCDVGAYLVGSAFGKHKMCPEISPKKTVEGAVGGIVSSMLITVVIVAIFSIWQDLIKLLIITPFMCGIGMMGDLFASVIKRRVGIKDYGILIPGHGGIMDRFDSILLIAPAFIMLLHLAEVIV